MCVGSWPGVSPRMQPHASGLAAMQEMRWFQAAGCWWGTTRTKTLEGQDRGRGGSRTSCGHEGRHASSLFLKYIHTAKALQTRQRPFSIRCLHATSTRFSPLPLPYRKQRPRTAISQLVLQRDLSDLRSVSRGAAGWGSPWGMASRATTRAR